MYRNNGKKMLFIQGGSRVRKCSDGTFYVDGNFNNDIWKRYKSYSNDVTVILREKNINENEKVIKDKFNFIDTNIINLKLVEDIYSPKINFFNFKKKKKIENIIKKEVKNADRIIIRSIGNFYTNTALKFCKKYKKKYLIEVTGFAFEGLWYHSFLGKLFAIPREIKLKRSIKNSPYAVYVTESALQKRYPCNGKTLGCSDVVIRKIEENKIKLNNVAKIKLGTAAFLDVKWKGQQDVIKAIYLLKKKQKNNFYYELIGTGNGSRLKKLIKKYRLENCVRIIGAKKHDEVFNWLKDLDVYIQPSYQEGLCRSIVEAMSVGCPVICTDVGGNSELIDNEYIYHKGDIYKLIEILKKINYDKLLEQSTKNKEKSKKFKKEVLDKKRDEFYLNFMM